MGGDGDDDVDAGPTPLIFSTSSALRLAVDEEPTEEKEEDHEPSAGELLEEFADGSMAAGKLFEDFTDMTILLDRGDSSCSFSQCQQDGIKSEMKDSSMLASVEGETDESSSTSTASKEDVVNSARVVTPETAVSKSLAEDENFTARKNVEAVQVEPLLEPATAKKSVPTQNGSRGSVKIAQNRDATSLILSSTTSNSTRKKLGESETKVQTKNPFDSFGEYVVNLFQKTIVYEKELELQQSQKNLQLNTPELDALAAVEAMSGFRNYSDVKRELRASFNEADEGRIKKKERLDGKAPTETETSTKLCEDQWAIFFQEKEKVKFNESAIVVRSCLLFDSLRNCAYESEFYISMTLQEPCPSI
jgi:hypothetical protein